MRAGGVRFEKGAEWYPTFEDELCKFPRGTKDDQVDAFAYIGLLLDSLIEAPTKQETEDEEYYERLHTNGAIDDGRNAWTGY
jgi:phage terminase large subunit-like protein